MFTPARIVILDDNEAHLHAIQRSVEALGSSCVGLVYSIDQDPPTAPFQRARVIFMDLQLRSREAASNFNVHFAEIQRLLKYLIPPDGGPFLLIVWTDRPEQVEALGEYLAVNLYSEHPHTRPVALIPMSKNEFIALDSGDATDARSLEEHLISQLEATPALAALLQWENDIVSASDRVIHDVVALAGATTAEPNDLAGTLRMLAEEAVGTPNLLIDPKGAVHSALLPLLQDHVQYEAVMAEGAGGVWGAALAGTERPSLSREAAAALNSQLHLGGTGGGLVPTTWGAVCELRTVRWPREFGIESRNVFIEHLLKKVKSDKGGARPDPGQVRPVQIRVGAACDYAQQEGGPIPYAVGAFVPLAHLPSEGGGAKSSLGPLRLEANATCWLSPMLAFEHWGIGHLLIDPRYLRTRGEESVKSFRAVNRIREQLLMELIAAISQHSARPGIVRFVGQG